MCDYYKELEWFLSDGSSIKGEVAYNYLSKELERFRSISKMIDSTLINCLKLNVISEDDSIDVIVCNAGESLSIVQIELEILIKKLNRLL